MEADVSKEQNGDSPMSEASDSNCLVEPGHGRGKTRRQIRTGWAAMEHTAAEHGRDEKVSARMKDHLERAELPDTQSNGVKTSQLGEVSPQDRSTWWEEEEFR